jgi:hypothetical protein
MSPLGETRAGNVAATCVHLSSFLHEIMCNI